MKEREQIDYLRAKIRAAANASLIDNPNDAMALNVFRVLRRKLSLEDCEKILSALPIKEVEAESPDDQTSNLTTTLTASDGQNVRHHHKSNKEHIDKENISQKKNHSYAFRCSNHNTRIAIGLSGSSRVFAEKNRNCS